MKRGAVCIIIFQQSNEIWLTDNMNMSDPTVETLAGKVRGKKVHGLDYATEFFSFKGIPYAKPPVGELRFKDPQPVDSWKGVRDTTSFGPNAAQKDFFTHEFMGTDDCLYLNVYARCINPKQRWPVMFWIHGGAFIGGTGDESFYGPDFFVSKDVVLVTINYRLGVLGFLNLDDEVAPGNQGLKDQVMALKWVRDNISNFGGDPNNVTIFGESAGGGSVHYLTISPLADGLFHKAIPQSGVVLNPWACHSNTSIKEKAYRLCQELGHTDKDPKSIVQFLKTVDLQKLIETQENIVTVEEKMQFIFSFGPSIDSKSKHPFMPVNPEEAAAKGTKVPIIIGYCSREGIIFLKELLENLEKTGNDLSKMLSPSMKDTIKKYYNLTAEELIRIYFDDQPVTKENHDKLADFVSDLHFVEGIQRVIKNQIEKNCAPTYVYQFTYDKEPSLFKLLMNIQMNGATHGDELAFLFRAHLFEGKIEYPREGSTRHRIREQMIEMWVNFATTGMPTPKLSELLPISWEPVSDKTGLRYLSICEELHLENAVDIEQHYNARKYPRNVI